MYLPQNTQYGKLNVVTKIKESMQFGQHHGQQWECEGTPA